VSYGAFEDVHRDRIIGSLAMFDWMIFKGHLSALYKQDGARCFLWSHGVALKDFTAYAKATTERIANNARNLVTDDEFGFMHVRIQGWIPCECQIYINGREWLARQLDRRAISCVRYDNSLLAIDKPEAAATLCDRFAHKAWPRVLNAFARMLNPILPAIGAAGYGGYYWVLDQAEIATDVMFKTRPQLLQVWPDLVCDAALNMSSEDVLGFLGRKLHPSLQAQVVTDTKRRPQGWRIRHRMAATG
jgi:hypothetical protein